MALSSGLDAQFGFASESTYGTAVTVTRFHELNGAPTVEPDIQHVMIRGLGRGRTQRSGQIVAYSGNPSVEASFVLFDRNMGLLLKHCLGAVVTTGASAPYTHTLTRGTTGTTGLSATVQVGVPDVGGTVRPYNFTGAKVREFTLGCQLGEALILDTTWDAKAFETSTSLATKSYAASAVPMVFTHGAATINSSSVSIRGFKLTTSQGLAIDRRFMGNVKKEPAPADEFTVVGTLDFEFEDLTRTTALVAGTVIQNLVLIFTVGSYSLTITIPAMIYTSGAGEIQETDVTKQSMEWKALDNGTDEIITMVYLSPDSAA